MPLLNAAEWETFLNQYPDAHLLQTAAWGDAKADFGWEPVRVVHRDAGAQILMRRLPLGLRIAYIPKGPLGQPGSDFWQSVHSICRHKRAVFLRVEPDAWEQEGGFSQQFSGWQAAAPIQPRQTMIVSLQGSEADWLARMKQKTRYNIRLAERKNVIVSSSSDVAEFHRLMIRTGERDQFAVHSQAYYRRVFDLFSSQDSCVLLMAYFQNTPLAGLMAFTRGRRAWYLYGASSDLERSRMPTYLLQWEAMRWAAGQGCESYDLYGIPDAPENELEANFEQRSDGLWGVYRFKRGFGGDVCRSAGAWDYIYSPLLYQLYRVIRSRRGALDG